MNRSILIVICDFLLVSLLVFSSPDMNKATEEVAAQNLKFEMATNQVDSGRDLTAAMRQALDEERRKGEQLLGELARTRESLTKQQELTTEREKQVQVVQETLQARELKAAQLEQKAAQLEQQTTRLQQQTTQLEQQASQLSQDKAGLQQQYSATQTNLQAISEQLRTSSVEALISKEKLAAMEAEAKKQTDQAAALQQQLALLSQSNAAVLAEKQQISGQLQVAMAEKRSATEQVQRMQDEVKVERAEKAKLAEGVKALASKSDELAQEVRVNRPLAPNMIFFEYLTNRVQASINASRSGLLGGTKRKDNQTVLVTNGTNTFALCHVQDTPLSFYNPGTEWESLTGSLSRETAQLPINLVIFSLQDPRLVLIPLSAGEASQLGGKVYKVSSDPYKFQDAVLIGGEESYYGECKFQIDVSTPGYVRLDRSVLRGLFGKFNPSRGDLVFSKNGEVLGIMANSAYCMMLQNFDGTARLRFSPDVRDQHTGAVLSMLYGVVSGMPSKLQ
jgi:hypothetical protein